MATRTVFMTSFITAAKPLLASTAIVVGTQLVGFSVVMAESKTPAVAQPKASVVSADANEKVDVADLEKKYWASKDTDFSVVQNRIYTKANRFALSLQYGTLVNDPWSDGPTMSGNLAYYFSERLGLEAHYEKTNSVDNKALINLKAQSGTANRGKIMGFQGLSANWVPFYAKMSVLNGTIIYFDMAISPGVGVTNYDQQLLSGNQSKTAPTLSLDITQSFFFNKYMAFRIDYKNRWFQEQILSYNTGASVSTETSQTSLLLFGLTFFY